MPRIFHLQARPTLHNLSVAPASVGEAYEAGIASVDQVEQLHQCNERALACLSNHISTKEGPVGVIGIEIFKHDIRVIKGLKPGANESVGVTKWVPAMRGRITELSVRSRLRMLHTVKNTGATFKALLTGTYPDEFPADGKIVKAHINALLMAIKRRYGTDVQYLWFLEFQKRGAPHWHMFLDQDLKKGDRAWLASTWYRIVASQDEKHLHAGTSFEKLRSVEGASRYAAKYATKTYQKVVPEEYQNVGRFWGHSSGAKAVCTGKFTADAATIVEKLGFNGAMKFVNDHFKFRNYLWDCAHLFDQPMPAVKASPPLPSTVRPIYKVKPRGAGGIPSHSKFTRPRTLTPVVLLETPLLIE